MPIRRSSRVRATVLPVLGAAAFVALMAAQNPPVPGDPLVAGFKSTYAASVSDAVETYISGSRGPTVALQTPSPP
ncbi:MAG TPA: hypothetical protein VIC61_05735, partial [Gammaproteobacteria bacterium]